METLKKVTPFRLSSLLRQQKDSKLALQLFRNPNPESNTSKNPFRYSLLSYDLIITKLCHAKMFDEMEKILDQMKLETNRFSPKEAIFCNIIISYGRSRLSKKALQMFDQIPSFKCQRTVKSFNSLLSALLNCREFEKVQEFYNQIDQYGYPDVYTYNILINCYCLSNNIDAAWKLFDEMREKGISLNSVTFATLVSGLCANSKLDEALKLKEDMMRKYNVSPNLYVYTSLIKGFCKINKLDLAFKLKDEILLKKELSLDSAIYTTLISALFRASRKEEALEVLEEMRENGCKPDTVTYNALISGYCNEKDFDSAFGVLDEMKEKGCKPDVISYNVIIGGYCKEGKLVEAMDLFEDMPRRDCRPDVVTYRTLFDGLCVGIEFKEAAFMLEEMVFLGNVPRLSSLNNFVDGLFREGELELLSSVLNTLIKGVSIDVNTWRMLMTMVCKKVELSKLVELVDACDCR